MSLHRQEVLAAWPVWLVAALLCLVCGCSTFNHAWREAGCEPTQTDSIEGRWEGRWISDVNGHNGKLRCVISRQADGNYAARFRATYWGVLRLGYIVTLKFERQNDGWQFSGEENLGKMAGGVYRYHGRATATEFNCNYNSKYDRGIFEMRRL